MEKILIILVAVVFVFGLSACEKKRIKNQDIEIMEYIAANNLDAQKTEDGIYYVIDNQGGGAQPNSSSEVIVHYEGTTLDGTVFDSSFDRGTPSRFFLYQVIQGWQKGIPFFNEGGRGKLIIPSRWAYGKTPPNGSAIGKNEILVFEIQLIEVL